MTNTEDFFSKALKTDKISLLRDGSQGDTLHSESTVAKRASLSSLQRIWCIQ